MSKMNSTQKQTVVISAVAIVLMLIFPPYHFDHHFTLNSSMDGYKFIGSSTAGGYINWALLFVQWAAVVFLAAVIFIVSKDE